MAEKTVKRDVTTEELQALGLGRWLIVFVLLRVICLCLLIAGAVRSGFSFPFPMMLFGMAAILCVVDTCLIIWDRI